MNLDTLRKLSYGIYIVSSSCEGKRYNGQIANTVFQVCTEPVRIAICINKKNFTHQCIEKSGKVGISILAKDSEMKLIERFGFRSGRDIDKFDGIEYEIVGDVPIVREGCIGYLREKVIDEVDVGSHDLFIVEIDDAEIFRDAEPMTYNYYHRVKKGKSPKNAPTYIKKEGMGEGMKMYRCKICGYIYNPEKGDPENGIVPGTSFDDLPDDWTCPVCGAGKEEFEEVL